MPLTLRDDDFELELHLPVSEAFCEAFAIQIQRAACSDAINGIALRVAGAVAASLQELLDDDLRPPTAKQVKFATDIAAGLCINLPGEALCHRGEMGRFLTRHAPAFLARAARTRGTAKK